MTAEPAAAPAAPMEPLRPISSSERVESIDILRGLALFGILAANIRGFAGAVEGGSECDLQVGQRG